jgi:hypothetical protein
MLHAAAGKDLSSITTTVQNPQQLSSLLQQLTRHAQHIKALDLTMTDHLRPSEADAAADAAESTAEVNAAKAEEAGAAGASVPFMLPSNLKLDSLSLTSMVLSSPRDLLGILPAGSPIKWLRLNNLRVQSSRTAAAAIPADAAPDPEGAGLLLLTRAAAAAEASVDTVSAANAAAEALATMLLGLPQLNHLLVIMQTDPHIFGSPPAVTAAVTFPG